MINLKPYLDLTTMMILATKDAEGNPYTSNVYFDYDENYTFYFKSKIYREHSKHILEIPNVAWSVINTQKYERNAGDKKGLQFQGITKVLRGKEAEKISQEIYDITRTYEEMVEEGHYIFACIPTRVKIWDEEIYGGDGKVVNLE